MPLGPRLLDTLVMMILWLRRPGIKDILGAPRILFTEHQIYHAKTRKMVPGGPSFSMILCSSPGAH